MRPLPYQDNERTDFYLQATFAIAATALLLVTPFAINNLIQQRTTLGVGALLVVAILALNVWYIKRGHKRPELVFYCLTPALISFLAFAFHQQGIVAAFWCYPTVLSFYCMMTERKAWISNAILLAIMLPHFALLLPFELASRLAATLIAVSIFSAVSVHMTNVYQKTLHSRIVTDPLTGLFNRSLLNVTLGQAVEQNHRHGTPMVLLALDLDHFKVINDSFGHEAGDKVLSTVGEILDNRIRRSDTAFRMGGEEFLCLLYGTDLENALLIAEHIRKTIKSRNILPQHSVTTSIGVAALEPNESWDEWCLRADNNLYAAKNQGRNCVVS